MLGIIESKRNGGEEENTPIPPSEVMEGRRLREDDQNSRKSPEDSVTEAKERVSKGRTVQWYQYRQETCGLVTPTPAYVCVPSRVWVVLLCAPACMGCLPPKAQPARGVRTWHFWSRANRKDTKSGEDHAGGHGTNEDLEGHHHLLCLLARSCRIPCKPGEIQHPAQILLSLSCWRRGPGSSTAILS